MMRLVKDLVAIGLPETAAEAARALALDYGDERYGMGLADGMDGCFCSGGKAKDRDAKQRQAFGDAGAGVLGLAIPVGRQDPGAASGQEDVADMEAVAADANPVAVRLDDPEAV